MMKNIKKSGRIFLLLIAGLLAIAVLPVTAHAATIVVYNATQLQVALSTSNDHDVIQLGANITYTNNIVLAKYLSINLGSYTLTLSPSSGDALNVGSGGQLTYTSTGGHLNVVMDTTSARGLYVHDGGVASVSSITKTGSGGATGVYCDGGTATVQGPVTVVGVGIQTISGTVSVSDVSVSGDYMYGIVSSGGVTMVDGAVSADGDNSRGVSVSGGDVQVGDIISAEGKNCYAVYVQNSGARVTADGVTASGTSSTGIFSSGEVQTGAVTATGTNCAGVSGSGIAADSVTVTGEGSRGVVTSSGTIAVEGSVSATGVNSYGAFLSGGQFTAASVSANGTTGACTGIYVINVNSAASSANVSVTGAGSRGLDVRSEGDFILTGSVTASGTGSKGVFTSGSSTVEVSGSVSATGTDSRAFDISNNGAVATGAVIASGLRTTGIFSNPNTTIAAASVTASGQECCGVYVNGGYASVTVGTEDTSGDIEVTGVSCKGVHTILGTVVVHGDINAGDLLSDYYCSGIVVAGGSAEAENVVAEGDNCKGVIISGGSASADSITAEGDDCIGVNATSGSVTAGSIQAQGPNCIGVSADDSSVSVGSVQAAGSECIGVYAGSGGEVTVDEGITTTAQYISISGTPKAQGDITTPTTKSGYNTYTDDTSTVWVRAFHAVTFMDGGSTFATRTVAEGQPIGSDNWPVDPSKDGFAFSGWFTGEDGTGTGFNENTSVNADTTLHVWWRVECTVTLMDGSETYAIRTTLENTCLGDENMPADPTKTGYSFAGWYTGENGTGSFLDKYTTVTTDIVVYAYWLEECTITAAPNDVTFGTTVGDGTFDIGETVTLTATPNEGYRFVCWKNGSTQVSTSAVYTFAASVDMSLTAEFAPIGTPALSAASAGYSSAQLTWTAVEGAAGYEVWRSASADGVYTKLGIASATTYTDTGLTMNTAYYYKVNAYCTAFAVTTYGSLSNYASATPLPSAPTSPVAVMASYSSIAVSWNAVDGASGYQLYRATSPDGKYSLLKTTTAVSYTNTSLKTGTTYYYKVRAYRTVGRSKIYGDYSSIFSATPVLSSVSTATATAYYPTSIKVSWSSVPGRTKYEVWRAQEGGEYTLVKTTTSTYWKDTTRTPFVTYYYYIRVYRSVSGQKIYGDSSSPTVSAMPILANVTGVTAVSYSSSSFKISWSSVTGASGYEVRRSDSIDGTYTTVKFTSSRSYTDTNRIPNQTYYYQVVAYRKVGTVRIFSTPTSPVSAAAYLGTVTNLKAVRSSTTKIKLTWSSVSGKTGYEIYRSATYDGEYVSIGTTTSTYYYNGGLTTGVTYYYKLRAYKTIGGVRYYSGYTDIASATP